MKYQDMPGAAARAPTGCSIDSKAARSPALFTDLAPRRIFLRHAMTLAAGAMGWSNLSVTTSLFAQDRDPATGRSALVIGNSNYPFGRLRNPGNDARLMDSVLRASGFDVVLLENGSLSAMLDAMKGFVARARRSQVRFFFFAGHGLQHKGANYLIPVDATTIDDDRLNAQMVNVSAFIEQLTLLQDGVNLVVLDACRTGLSPTAGRRRGRLDSRAAAGLAQMSAPRGTLIAFSTSPGEVALDGTTENSVYTRQLAKHLSVPGLLVEQMFKRVRISVAKETSQAQIPWETSSLMGDFCFLPDGRGRCE